MAQEEDRHADHLEAEDQWDLETPVEHEKARAPRALVSVSFRPEDLEIVATAAEGAGTPLSTFIREAALERARSSSSPIVSVVTAHGPSTGTQSVTDASVEVVARVV